jgi:cytochrome c oxidase subunit II
VLCVRHARILYRLSAAAPAALVTGCVGPLSTLDPAGPAAGDIAALWWVMLAGAAALTVLVLTLLALSFRRGRPEGRSSTRVWIFWLGLALPAVVLGSLLGHALFLGERWLARKMADVVVVEATGHQWHWTFRQPGLEGAIATRNELHIPAGRPIDVRVGSADVIHSFWVPRLGGKMDAIPGHVNVVRLLAQQPGVFEGQCAEFCGLQHANNRFRVIAHDAAAWARFQREGAQ